MSVVVYHRGQMAADTRAYSGNSHPAGNKMKIHRLNDGSLVGIVSNQIGTPEAFVEWLNSGASRDDLMPSDPSFSAIQVKADGSVYLYDDGYTPAGPLVGETFTIGSGRKYALGAIKMGATIIQAVEVAIELDVWCGGPVAALALHEQAVADGDAMDGEHASPAFDPSGFSTSAVMTNEPAPNEPRAPETV
ncbi:MULTISPECIES: hypothetical protein [unclassified Ensifer]|uniref:hypothetical protein n=1 Tax=unclassified Ensifer TaxID=2633371 RepID=UPI0008132B0F|nr:MULTISPECIES: hypothetical protein [unclassified Ensifer]OCP21927.1 hypothetical protein BC361_25500 [Ensifer sp. LC54]OCP23293.1 hypothetical protein BC363_25265 [Ensifer sp. LC384]